MIKLPPQKVIFSNLDWQSHWTKAASKILLPRLSFIGQGGGYSICIQIPRKVWRITQGGRPWAFDIKEYDEGNPKPIREASTMCGQQDAERTREEWARNALII